MQLRSVTRVRMCQNVYSPRMAPQTSRSVHNIMKSMQIDHLDGNHAGLLADGQTCMPHGDFRICSKPGMELLCMQPQSPHHVQERESGRRTCVTSSEGDAVHESMAGQIVSNLASSSCSSHTWFSICQAFKQPCMMNTTESSKLQKPHKSNRMHKFHHSVNKQNPPVTRLITPGGTPAL